jgi:type VI secretion system secreted protein VgrG
MAGCDVFWQVGSSATLGTGTAFEGNVLAATSITADFGASVLNGRLLAENGAVTLDSNFITVPSCDTDGSSVPDAVSTMPLAFLAFGGVIFLKKGGIRCC